MKKTKLMAVLFLSITLFSDHLAAQGNDEYLPNPGKSNSNFSGRDIIDTEARAKNATVRISAGHTSQESADLWHMSEGADIFPLKWFLHMKGATSNDKDSLVSEYMDKKFNLIRELEKFADSHKYPLKYVGLTLTTSDAHPEKANTSGGCSVPSGSFRIYG